MVMSPNVCRTHVQPACQRGGPDAKPPAARASEGSTSENRCSICGMWRPVNTMCRLRAAWSALLLALILALCPPPAHALTPQGEEPDPIAARAAFDALRVWVESGEVPDWTRGGGEALPDLGPNVGGVAITLRLAGSVVGRGRAFEASGQPPALIAAARAAIAEARERGHYEPGFLEGMIRPGQRLAITLELATPLVQMQPAELAEAATLLRPGIDGVAFRVGTRQVVRFPSQMLQTRTLPADALPALVAEFTGDPATGLRPPAESARRLNGRFFRFRTLQLAQPEARAEPLFLHRAGRLVRSGDVTTPALRDFAQGLAAHLIARDWTSPEASGMRGGYDPVTGAFDPGPASDLDQAVTAFALLRFVNRVRGVGLSPDAPLAADARLTAMGLLRRFTTREGLARLEDPVLASMVAAALVEAGARLDEDRAELAAFDRALLVCANVVRESYTPAGGFARSIPPSARSLVAFGLTAVAEASGRFPDLTRAEGAAGAIYRETPPGRLVGEMPWLGWAAVRAAGWRAPDEPIPQGEGLRQLRADVWLHQLAPRDLEPPDADLVGGIVFTAAGAPLPSWQNARPLAFIATMLGDRRLTDENERMPELVRLMGSLRFLMQLAAQRAEGHMYADPAQAQWGVRSSPWDQRMPVQASALTLLTLVETLSSIERLTERPPTPQRGD